MVAELVGDFPFEDTPDQARASIAEIMEDLPRPADGSHRPRRRRFRKDRAPAVRATFRGVAAAPGRGTSSRRPSLAHQHYAIVPRAFAAFPVEVALVSRHVGEAETNDVLARTRSGQRGRPDRHAPPALEGRSFKRLGLVVVDEEQRFGVQHKGALQEATLDHRRADSHRDADPGAHSATCPLGDPRHRRPHHPAPAGRRSRLILAVRGRRGDPRGSLA